VVAAAVTGSATWRTPTRLPPGRVRRPRPGPHARRRRPPADPPPARDPIGEDEPQPPSEPEGPERKVTSPGTPRAAAGPGRRAPGGLGLVANSASAGSTAQPVRGAASVPTPPPVPGHRGLVGSTVPLSALHAGGYYAGKTPNAADAAWEAAVGRRMSVTKKYN